MVSCANTAVERATPLSLAVEFCGPEVSPTLLREAEALVDSPFACLAYVRAFHPEIIPQLRHAVVRSGAQLFGILSFHTRRDALIVVNRLLRWPGEVLDVCAAAMLAEHPRILSVNFNDLYHDEVRSSPISTRPLSWRTIDCVVVELPSSYPVYFAGFGATTQKNLRYCARRLKREAPDVEFRIYHREQINADAVAAMVQLNHKRMAFKNKTSGIDPQYASKLRALAETHGVACIAADGSTIVGGTLCTTVGNGWTLHVIAHDPRFNHVRLGLLCLLKTVEEAIASGASRFNFLWGMSEYKLLFGGKVATLRARRYYRDFGARLLALDDLRNFVFQSLRWQVSSWRRSYRARMRN
jgi:Acetyltransferase (GNAT) domain